MTELLRPLAWLEPGVDVLRLGVFAVFVALGLMAARRRQGASARRRGVDHLLLYVTAVSFGVGLTQVEAWPFSNWALVHGLSARRAARIELEALDAQGRSWPVDLRALQPVPPEEFASWMRADLDRLGPEARDSVGRWLLGRAEDARRRVRAGGRAAPNERWLGALTAPHHVVFPAHLGWQGRGDVSEQRFTAVRLWVLEWDVEARAAGSGEVTRRLALEFHG